jgi:diguanylate cyclase (GGDEF)-like protein
MYTLLPVVAGLVAGWTAAAGWAAAVVLAWVGLFSVERAGHAFAGVLPPESFQPSLLLNLIISGSIAAAVVVIYERMNETLRRTLARERAQFEYQARHDALTGIPNRRLFEELLDLALRRADRTKLKVALLILDLDDFKPINDRFGHATGDAVLCQVATRLRRFLRVTDTVSRLGGDEFAVVIELLSSREDAEGIAAKILDEISLPLRIQGRDLGVSASIGTALYPDDAEDVESLLAAADATMYSAKRRGGSRT